MPNFDKTGPEGKGSMTGRGDGPCNADSPRRGVGRNVRGRGFGAGRGAGRGFGRGVQLPADEK